MRKSQQTQSRRRSLRSRRKSATPQPYVVLPPDLVPPWWDGVAMASPFLPAATVREHAAKTGGVPEFLLFADNPVAAAISSALLRSMLEDAPASSASRG